MKGEIFVALMSHLEEALGYETLDKIVVDAGLPSKGSYTRVGHYAHQEALALVHGASIHTGVDEATLVRGFGTWLFSPLAQTRLDVVEAVPDSFALLLQIESVIHQDVRKLQPDAELPTIVARLLDPLRLEILYESQRPFAELAHGLLLGAIRHYDDKIRIERSDAGGTPGTQARFLLTREA